MTQESGGAAGRGARWLIVVTVLLAMPGACRTIAAADGRPRCSQCQRAACPQCRLADGGPARHRECHHGLCPAHCPVRPDVFGFYGTKWRRWPGDAVAPGADADAAAPARPPRAEVPGPAEESLPEQEPAAATGAPDAPAENLPEPASGGQREPATKEVPETSSRSRPWRSFTADERTRLAAQP